MPRRQRIPLQTAKLVEKFLNKEGEFVLSEYRETLKPEKYFQKRPPFSSRRNSIGFRPKESLVKAPDVKTVVVDLALASPGYTKFTKQSLAVPI